MIRRSSIGAGPFLKQFWRLARHPWIGTKWGKLEIDKRLFNLFPPRHRNGKAAPIRQLSIRITDVCNLRCHTCGQWGDSGFLHGKELKELKREEVPPHRYNEIFTDLVRHGMRPMVYFWGGEPMLYDGILDLIDGARFLGLPSAIATNGTHLTAASERLVQIPLFLLQISIDGHCADLHNSARPSAGGGNNFAQILSGLDAVNHVRRARKRNLPLIASLTVISQTNFRHLVDIYDAFRDRVDLFVFYLSWWIDPQRARDHELDFRRRFGFLPTKHRGWIGDWKPDDFRELDRQLDHLLERARSWDATPVTLIPHITGEDNLRTYYTDHKARFGFDQCVSIYQVVEVDSNGDVSPCRDYHDYVVGNIKSATITDLLNSPEYTRFRRSLTQEGLMPVCSRCCGLMGY